MSPRKSKAKKPKATKTTKTKKAKGGSSSDKPPLDAYTALLMAGFLAVVTGCALLTVELSKYNWQAAN